MSLRRFLRLAPKVLFGILLVMGIGVAVLLGPYALRVERVAEQPGRGFHSGYYLYVPASLRRFGLVVRQIHAIGNRSLVIILASGREVAGAFLLYLLLPTAFLIFRVSMCGGMVVFLCL